MANSVVVQHFSGNVIAGNLCNHPTPKKSTSTTKITRTAPLMDESNTSDREGVRDVFFKSRL